MERRAPEKSQDSGHPNNFKMLVVAVFSAFFVVFFGVFFGCLSLCVRCATRVGCESRLGRVDGVEADLQSFFRELEFSSFRAALRAPAAAGEVQSRHMPHPHRIAVGDL